MFQQLNLRMIAVRTLAVILVLSLFLFIVYDTKEKTRKHAEQLYEREQSAFVEGLEAGKIKGIPVIANPYTQRDYEYEYWQRGWLKGKTEIEQ